MVANILPTDHPNIPLTMGMRSMSKFNFSEHGHVAYIILWIIEMSQHGSKYFRADPPPHPADPRVKMSKLDFLERGHLA